VWLALRGLKKMFCSVQLVEILATFCGAAALYGCSLEESVTYRYQQELLHLFCAFRCVAALVETQKKFLEAS